MKPLICILLLFVFRGPVPPKGGDATGVLSVRIENIRQATGSLWIGVYESEHDFLDRHRARLIRRPVERSGSMRVPVDRLTVGKRYALAVFHDQNDNGELDTNWLGLPAEPYVLSQPLRSWLRAPRFAEMSFVFRPEEGLPPLRLR